MLSCQPPGPTTFGILSALQTVATASIFPPVPWPWMVHRLSTMRLDGDGPKFTSQPPYKSDHDRKLAMRYCWLLLDFIYTPNHQALQPLQQSRWRLGRTKNWCRLSSINSVIFKYPEHSNSWSTKRECKISYKSTALVWDSCRKCKRYDKHAPSDLAARRHEKVDADRKLLTANERADAPRE